MCKTKALQRKFYDNWKDTIYKIMLLQKIQIIFSILLKILEILTMEEIVPLFQKIIDILSKI